jgi:Aromatic acid exporter family member 1
VPISIPGFRRHRAKRIGAAARAVAQRTPETLTVVRHRAQPTAVTVARLAGTAVFAYLLALALPVSPNPVLAPLTALLVAQVSLYQTLRSAARRVAAVVAGVLLAVALSAWVGFTWWSLGITIVVALAIGFALHLGDAILEVPISAMLILSVAGTRAAATGRIIETFIGAAAGLAAGLVFAPPRVQLAAEAIEDLCRKMADLLNQMAIGLRDGSVLDRSGNWLGQARSLGGEIQRVDDALRQAEDSVRLNPRGLRLLNAPVSLRGRLETLEHAAITVRGLARTLADSTRLADDVSPMQDPEARGRLAGVLEQLAAAVRTYGRLAAVAGASGQDQLAAELERYLSAAHDQQDRLSELLGTDPAIRPVGWPLRGELISHLDRLRNELRAGSPSGPPRARRMRSWRRPLQAGRRQPRSPTRQRGSP